MATLYYYNFKNYYYPSTKRFSDLSGYQPYLVYSETSNNLNFYDNDGVNTEIIAGRSGNPYYDKANYVIYSNDSTEITSRWYIIDAVKNSSGQYKLQLHRDLPVDYYDEWTQSDCFIEKAILPDSSPFIYNQEQITTNQIKKSENQLKDQTKIAWICCFVDKTYKQKQDFEFNVTILPDKTTSDITKESWYKYSQTPAQVTTNSNITLTTKVSGSQLKARYEGLNGSYRVVSSGNPVFGIYNSQRDNFGTWLSERKDQFYDSWDQYKSLYVGSDDQEGIDSIGDLKGKIYFDSSTKKYYKLSYEDSEQTLTTVIDSNKAGDNVYTSWNNIINSAPSSYISSSGTGYWEVEYSLKTRKLVISEVTQGQYKMTYPETHLDNKDGPFDIFCIPYSDGTTIVTGNDRFTTNKQLAMSIASEIGRNMSNFCYDIQLLPYCPFMHSTTYLGSLLMIDPARFTPIKDSAGKVQYGIFFSDSSSGTFDIKYKVNITNKKMSNQVDMMRLVSPNFASQFEFNPARNDGISYFNVDYTYLPLGSYIHVNPDFNCLYGKDFNDARGLICQGDFSIMYLNDAWKSYQTQNKNYLEIFNRQVESIETNYKYQRINSVISTITGAIGAGTGVGALISGKAGVGVGIGAGAASLGGGIADFAIQQKLHNEQLDYKNDMFGYQLDNIKALPHSIAKTTAYNENNKIFPILEYYTCTDEEKEAVANKIAYNSMTVGIIAKPINYIGNSWSYGDIQDKGYIKCKLIKLEGTQANDFHLVNMLGEELNKGVYTK